MASSHDRFFALIIVIGVFGIVGLGIALDFSQLAAKRDLSAKSQALIPCGAEAAGLREQIDALHAFRARQEEQNARFEAAIAEAERLTGMKLR